MDAKLKQIWTNGVFAVANMYLRITFNFMKWETLGDFGCSLYLMHKVNEGNEKKFKWCSETVLSVRARITLRDFPCRLPLHGREGRGRGRGNIWGVGGC